MASLLDTDVVSQRIKLMPDPRVMQWLGGVPHQETYVSVITIQEIRTGIALLPAGRKRRDLESWLENDIKRNFAGRILPVTLQIADLCGRILGGKTARAFHPDVSDAYIAATAQVHGLEVATLNRKHFEKLGVELAEF